MAYHPHARAPPPLTRILRAGAVGVLVLSQGDVPGTLEGDATFTADIPSFSLGAACAAWLLPYLPPSAPPRALPARLAAPALFGPPPPPSSPPPPPPPPPFTGPRTAVGAVPGARGMPPPAAALPTSRAAAAAADQVAAVAATGGARAAWTAAAAGTELWDGGGGGEGEDPWRWLLGDAGGGRRLMKAARARTDADDGRDGPNQGATRKKGRAAVSVTVSLVSELQREDIHVYVCMHVCMYVIVCLGVCVCDASPLCRVKGGVSLMA